MSDENEKPKEIFVEYTGRTNDELDQVLKDCLKEEGYVATGEGYQMGKKIRDLHFVLKSEMDKKDPAVDPKKE